jgi:hypothetical protein
VLILSRTKFYSTGIAMNRRYITIIMMLFFTCVLVFSWRNTWINTVSIGHDDEMLVHGFFDAESFVGQYMRWSTDVATVRVLHPPLGLAVATVRLLNRYPAGTPPPAVTLLWSNTPSLMIHTIKPGYIRSYMSLIRSTSALPWYEELTIKSTTWKSVSDTRSLGVVVSAVGLRATTLMLPIPAPAIFGAGILLILLIIVSCQYVFVQQVWQITVSAVVVMGIIYAGVVQPYSMQPFLLEGCVGVVGILLGYVLFMQIRRKKKSITGAIIPQNNGWPWWLESPHVMSRTHWVVVCLGGLLCTVLMTWPVVFQISDGVMTTPERVLNPDLGQNVWNVWHFVNTWQQGDLLWSRLVSAPLAINMVTQSYGLTNLIVSLPVALLFGPVVAANTIVLLGFWAGIVLMTVLAYRVCGSLPLAFVIGCLFVLTPAHLKNVEWAADENAALHWLVLVHLVGVWWLRRPDVRRSAGLVGTMIVVSLSSGYFGLFGMVYLSLMVVISLWARPLRDWRGSVGIWYAIVGVAWAGVMAVLSSDMTNPLRQAGVRWDATQIVISGGKGLADWVMRQTTWLHVVSFADLVTPLSNHPVWGLLPPIVARPFPSEMGGYLGLVCIGIFIWTLYSQPLTRIVGGFAGVLILLSFGLDVKLWYDQSFSPLPGLFWGLDVVGVFRNASRPGLFLLYAWIPLLLVISYGLPQITRRWLLVLLCVAMIVDFLPPRWVVVPIRATAGAALIPHDGPRGAVLTLPVGKNDQQPLIDQMCHLRPIVTGYLARTPIYPVDWGVLTQPADQTQLLLPYAGVTALQNMGIRYIVTQNLATTNAVQALANDGVQAKSMAGNDRLFVVPDGTLPVLMTGTGWWDQESSGGRRWRWTASDADLVLFSSTPRQIELVVHVSTLAGGVSEWTLNDRSIGSLAIAAQPEQTERVLTFVIPAGRSVLHIYTPTVLDGNGRVLGLAFTQLYVRSAKNLPLFAAIPELPYPTKSYCVLTTP